MEAWEEIDWAPDQLKSIYHDWAEFYACKQRLPTADKYFNLSLSLKMDPRVLCQRSKCKRQMAQTESALADSEHAARLNSNASDIQREICDALYELNQFENCKIALHNSIRKWKGNSKQQIFKNHLVVIDENFKDTIGESLRPFIFKNEKHFATIVEEIRKEKNLDTRYLWKILIEMGKCDVLSILEKEEMPVSPMEMARRERATKVIDQIYLSKNWIDMLFLKSLKENQMPVLLYQAPHSSKPLNTLMQDSCRTINKFLKMLQARSPLYNEKMRKCPNKKVCERFANDNLSRIQYQTRRNMLSIIRSIRGLRNVGKVEKLSDFVENVMGKYVVIKTHRIMPWKFEFLNEVYNTLGLAHTDLYSMAKMPSDLKDRPPNDQINIMLRLNKEKPKERAVQFIFGDRTTHEVLEGTEASAAVTQYKQRLIWFEKRLRFAKYPIERAYILHEMARSHLPQGRFEESCLLARKGVMEAKNCNSYLWQFLCTMIIAKAHMILHKVERARVAFYAARILAKHLKSYPIYIFSDYLFNINDVVIQNKKRSQSTESLKKRKTTSYSRFSLHSSSRALQPGHVAFSSLKPDL